MRQLAAVGFAAIATLGACGGSDNDSTEAATNSNGALSKLAANAATAEVCGGREALGIAAAFTGALKSGKTVDYDDVATALTKAAEAAPAEIKDDFRVIAEAEGPFLRILGAADLSNYAALASDQEYLAAISALGTEKFTQASANVNEWFADHCK